MRVSSNISTILIMIEEFVSDWELNVWLASRCCAAPLHFLSIVPAMSGDENRNVICNLCNNI